MDYLSVKYLIWAIALGGISAASLGPELIAFETKEDM